MPPVVQTRESINRSKIEAWRVSRVPVNPDESIFQGDLLVWDAANHRATKGTAASAATFIGMSDTKNQVETAGSPSFLGDTKSSRVNVLQQGLVEVIWGVSETVYPFDEVIFDSAVNNAQTCKKGSTNPVGIVDPSYGAAGTAITSGTLVKIWLRVPNAYRVHY